jgi:hypothetical protein
VLGSLDQAFTGGWIIAVACLLKFAGMQPVRVVYLADGALLMLVSVSGIVPSKLRGVRMTV